MRLSEVIRAEPRTEVDLFRWLLNVYDLKVDSDGRKAVCTKLKSFLVSRDLDQTVPGRMKGYTHLSLLSLVWMRHQEMPELAPEKYARSERLWVGTKSLSEILLALDTLSFRWRDLEDCADLQVYLDHIFRRAAWMCTRLHPKEILDTPSLRYECENLYRIHPSVVMQIASRLRFFARFPARRRRVQDTPVLSWLMSKKKNLKVRAYRAEILKLVWERMLLPGDQEIAPGTPLAAVQARFPPFLVEKVRRRIMHGDLEGDDLDMWCLHQAQQTLSPLGVDFKKVAYCTKEWKHSKRLHKIPIPIIVRRNHFYVLWLGQEQGPPTSFLCAFETWLRCLQDMCQSRCYGVHLESLIQEILSPREEEETFLVPL